MLQKMNTHKYRNAVIEVGREDQGSFPTNEDRAQSHGVVGSAVNLVAEARLAAAQQSVESVDPIAVVASIMAVGIIARGIVDVQPQFTVAPLSSLVLL